MTNTLTHLMSPYYTERWPLWTTPSVTVVRNLYVYAWNCLHILTVPKSEVGNSNILKLRKDSQGNGRFTTDPQGRIQTSDGDSMRGMIPQTQVTLGDTTCSEKGVLLVYVRIIEKAIILMEIKCHKSLC